MVSSDTGRMFYLYAKALRARKAKATSSEAVLIWASHRPALLLKYCGPAPSCPVARAVDCNAPLRPAEPDAPTSQLELAPTSQLEFAANVALRVAEANRQRLLSEKVAHISDIHISTHDCPPPPKPRSSHSFLVLLSLFVFR